VICGAGLTGHLLEMSGGSHAQGLCCCGSLVLKEVAHCVHIALPTPSLKELVAHGSHTAPSKKRPATHLQSLAFTAPGVDSELSRQLLQRVLLCSSLNVLLPHGPHESLSPGV